MAEEAMEIVEITPKWLDKQIEYFQKLVDREPATRQSLMRKISRYKRLKKELEQKEELKKWLSVVSISHSAIRKSWTVDPRVDIDIGNMALDKVRTLLGIDDMDYGFAVELDKDGQPLYPAWLLREYSKDGE